MNEELLAIVRIWENANAVSDLEARCRALVESERKARKDLKLAIAELDEQRARRKQIRQREARLLSKLDTHQRQLRNTRKLIDLGQASDYQLATRQVESCKATIGDLETQILCSMEELDQVDLQIEKQRERVEACKRAVASSREATRQELPGLEERLSEFREVLPRLESELRLFHLEHIKRLRQSGQSIVSRLRDGCCSSCHFMLAPQMVNEVQSGARVHTCRHCGRYLVPAD